MRKVPTTTSEFRSAVERRFRKANRKGDATVEWEWARPTESGFKGRVRVSGEGRTRTLLAEFLEGAGLVFRRTRPIAAAV